jgi:Leucine-rich repeat (LRR) protein
LQLDNNAIEELPSDVFHDLENLLLLYINNNQIKEFHRDLFRNNLQLRELNASNNKLQKIEFDFTKYNYLIYVGLKGNICIDAYVDRPLEERRKKLQEAIDENCH